MKKAADNRLDIYCACTSFYILMAFIPILVILISLIPFLPFTQDGLESAIMNIVPVEYKQTIDFVLDDLYDNSKTALSLSIVAMIWTSARGILGITKGLNRIHGVNETRSYVFMRIRSAFYTIFLIAGFVCMLLLQVFGNSLMALLRNYIEVSDFYVGLYYGKNIFSLLLTMVFFELLYVKLPDIKVKYKSQIWGAFAAGIIWQIFTRVFSQYLSTYNSYSVYGSVAVIIFLGVWVYTGIMILFYGAQFNEYLAFKKGTKNEGSN